MLGLRVFSRVWDQRVSRWLRVFFVRRVVGFGCLQSWVLPEKVSS